MDTPFVVKEKMSLVDTMMLIAVGSAALMFGVTALLNPNLPPHSSRYGWGSIFRLILETLPHNAAGWSLVLFGIVLLFFGAILAHSVIWPSRVLVVDHNGIESMSDKGKGRLAWRDVMKVRQIDNTLHISGSVPTRDISIEIDSIDKTVSDILLAIRGRRPDLA